MNKKIVLMGLTVGLWVSVYAVIQTLVGTILKIPHIEIWPVLMAPGLVSLLGGGKDGMISYFKTGTTGILAGLIFILSEQALVPVLGEIGLLLALTIIVALIVFLQVKLPAWFGPVSFVTFNASTILTDNIISLTVTRLIVLLVGGTLFLLVETKLVGLIMGSGKNKDSKSNS